MELKCRSIGRLGVSIDAPNCTLVELKYVDQMAPSVNSVLSKLYLSGIEIGNLLRGTSIRFSSKLYLSGIEIHTIRQCCFVGYGSKLYLSGIEIGFVNNI